MREMAAALAIVSCIGVPAAAQTPETAREIIELVDRVMRGDSSHGVARMEIVTEHWERQLTMELWSLGTDYSLVRLRAPAKEAGDRHLDGG